MTVSGTAARATYSGNGSTTAFVVPFYFLADAHLAVILRGADGVETTQTLNSDYTVTGAGSASGGSVTMSTAPASGETLAILREVPLTQETDYVENDPFPAETHERALDKLTMINQQQTEVLDRTFKVSEVSETNPTLPVPSEGAFIGWANGQLANFSPTLSAETLTFGAGLQKVGLDVSIELATTNPALEFSSGQLRAKVDDTTIERTASGLALKASGLPEASTAAAGVIEVANTTEMGAASSFERAVTPGAQRLHPLHPTAFVTFNGTGTLAVNKSANIGSVTDLGTGQYRANFSDTMADANYAVMVSSSASQVFVGSRTATSVIVLTTDSSGAAADASYVSIVIIGDLA